MNKAEKLSLICQTFCDNSKTRLAERIGVGTRVVTNWFYRDSFDVYAIAQAFPEINLDWLLRDKGEIIDREEPKEYNVQIYEPISNSQTEQVSERPAYNTINTQMVTVPASLLAMLEEQLRQKDKQIAKLIEKINE